MAYAAASCAVATHHTRDGHVESEAMGRGGAGGDGSYSLRAAESVMSSRHEPWHAVKAAGVCPNGTCCRLPWSVATHKHPCADTPRTAMCDPKTCLGRQAVHPNQSSAVSQIDTTCHGSAHGREGSPEAR